MTVLVLTDTHDLAADLIVLELQRRNVAYQRLNTDDFPRRLQISYDPARGCASFTSRRGRFGSGQIRAAWYRRPGPATQTPGAQTRGAQAPDGLDHGYATREAALFLRYLWAEMPWRWVNDPAAIDQASSKLWQLGAAARAGFVTPATLVGNQLDEVASRLGDGPVIAKTVGGAAIGPGGQRQNLFAQRVVPDELEPAAVQVAPCIFQQEVKPGTDVRVTVAGERVFATDIIAPAAHLDWRAARPETVTYQPIEPGELARLGRDFCARAGLRYAAFDFVRQPSGRYVFLEVNPSGQWGWIERATGQPITEAIVDVLTGEESA